jgi:hypothetical protein
MFYVGEVLHSPGSFHRASHAKAKNDANIQTSLAMIALNFRWSNLSEGVRATPTAYLKIGKQRCSNSFPKYGLLPSNLW